VSWPRLAPPIGAPRFLEKTEPINDLTGIPERKTTVTPGINETIPREPEPGMPSGADADTIEHDGEPIDSADWTESGATVAAPGDAMGVPTDSIDGTPYAEQ